MSITYTWKITGIERYATHESLSNVVVAVHWRLEASDANNNYGCHWGVQQLDLSRMDAENFVSFESLTEEQVIQWAINDINGSAAMSDEQIENGIVFTDLLEEDLRNIINTQNNQRLTGVPW